MYFRTTATYSSMYFPFKVGIFVSILWPRFARRQISSRPSTTTWGRLRLAPGAHHQLTAVLRRVMQNVCGTLARERKLAGASSKQEGPASNLKQLPSVPYFIAFGTLRHAWRHNNAPVPFDPDQINQAHRIPLLDALAFRLTQKLDDT